MGRRSDHTREELRELLLATGHAHMAEGGYARFSGREVAKRAGYSVGTIYNVFGSLDQLVAAVNSRTFTLWAEHLWRCLETGGDDRIRSLVEGYFSFALARRELWTAIYDHRLPDGVNLSEEDEVQRGVLTRIVTDEVERALHGAGALDVARLARSLIATVHGHCSFLLNGSFALMGETDPVGLALARVREILAQHGYQPPQTN